MKKLSIVIPVFNKINFTKSCLKDLSYLPNDHEIIVVDNGSTDETKSNINILQGTMHNLQYIRREQNFGFGNSVNLGFTISKNDIIMVLNNDIRVTDTSYKWLDDFVEFVYDSNCLVGPTGGLVDENFNFKYETNNKNDIINYMSAWCLSANKNTWNKLVVNNYGPFDSETFFAYFEDTDLGFRARAQNIDFEIYKLPIVHFGKQTSSMLNTYELYINSKNKFINKWDVNIEKNDNRKNKKRKRK